MNRVIEAASNHVREVGAVSFAILAAAGGVAVGTSFGGHEQSAGASNVPADIAANCGALTLTNTAHGYGIGKFLPTAPGGKISNPDQAAAYAQSWFGEKGPLAGTADRASLAVIDAAISAPALQKNAVNNSNSYTFQFQQDYSRLTNSATGQAEAAKLCEQESTVLGETAGYDGSAIAAGEQYTTFTAVEGTTDVTGLKLEQNTAKHDIAGVTFRAQNQGNKNSLNGFSEIIVEGDGTIDVAGWLPTGGKNPSNSSAPAGNKTSTGNGGGGVTGTSNGSSHSKAESPKPGQVQENQTGQMPGRNTGSGGQGIKTGPKPSPNKGGGNTTSTQTVTVPGNTVTTPAPANTVTVTTPSTTETSTTPTTTVTVPTTTTTTTTPAPKGSEPTCTPTPYTPC